MTDDPWIGKTVGRYRVEALVGRGGMGVVYRGTQSSLNRSVAIKILPPDLAEDQEFVRRFHQEAKAIAGLAHENIVYVFDIEEHEGTTYIVMEFIDGASLTSARDAGPLDVDEVRRIGIGVARALGHAHQRGIIHRDVKSANVMRTLDGRVKLTDFGIARVEGGMKTLTGFLPGTPAYMAPEQLQRGEVSPRSDLYSLGVLLFELSTGRLPWKGSDPISLALRRLTEDPPRARAFNPAVPDWLEEVILKLMARSPEERYASAAEVEQALVLSGLSVVDLSIAAAAYTTQTSPTAVSTARKGPPPLSREASAPPAPGSRRPVAAMAATVPGSPPPTLTTGPPRRSALPVLAGVGVLAVVVGVALAVFLPRSKPLVPPTGGGPSSGGAGTAGPVLASPTPNIQIAVTEFLTPPAAAPTAGSAEPGSVTVVELVPTAVPTVAPRPSRARPKADGEATPFGPSREPSMHPVPVPGAPAETPNGGGPYVRFHPLGQNVEAPVGIRHGPITIESVKVKSWPDAGDFRKAETDPDDTKKIAFEFRYSSNDRQRDWKCKYTISVEGKDGVVYGVNDRTATLDKGRLHDTNGLSVRVKTRALGTVKAFKATYELRRD